jgi:hypothetical protein
MRWPVHLPFSPTEITASVTAFHAPNVRKIATGIAQFQAPFAIA